MKQVLAIACFFLSLLLASKAAPQGEFRARVEALKKYLLEKEYPESFGETRYRTRVENILSVDIDNDGNKELVVQFHPHYRQSATVVIYKVSPELVVTRVMEGLAPGPLQKLSGDYLDSHELGQAIDGDAGDAQGKPGTTERLVQIALGQFGGVVVYRDFIHADGRKGSPAYIEMGQAKLPPKAKDCTSFEFSSIRQIAAGPVREDPTKNYLAAWVGDEIYVYLIRGISSQGMLDKKFWVIKAPSDFKGFTPGQGLAYSSASGTTLLTLVN